ncbi:MAG: hypothetical protein IPN81_08355 [Nitrosomonadales bacterium]|nr:hypothetical protein [Nitrosomonadales bacterium]
MLALEDPFEGSLTQGVVAIVGIEVGWIAYFAQTALAIVSINEVLGLLQGVACGVTQCHCPAIVLQHSVTVGGGGQRLYSGLLFYAIADDVSAALCAVAGGVVAVGFTQSGTFLRWVIKGVVTVAQVAKQTMVTVLMLPLAS